MLCGKANAKPDPLAPFPTREGGKVKASLLAGERFGEGFSRYREKSGNYFPKLKLQITLAERGVSPLRIKKNDYFC
jgi:hypothetical protein